METTYFNNNGSRRSKSSQNSRGSRREGCTCICNRESGKNIALVMALVLVLALTAALLVMGLSSQRMQRRYTIEEMEKAVEAKVRLFWDLFNEEQFEKLLELFAPDAQLMPPGKPTLSGTEAIYEHFKTTSSKSKVVIKDGRIPEVEIISDVMAFSVSDFRLTVDGNDAGRAKSIMLWKNIEGTWLIYRDIYNNSTVAQPMVK